MSTEQNPIINKIINWYQVNQRQLPWRETKDPYKIWLSEIILQQTRVDQGMPYYLNFVAHFPNVKDLAAASEQDVLMLWQGLGYYSRARNLHQCAQKIVDEYAGVFPKTYSELIKLKGIGPYTAAAVASIAFGEKVPVIDGNVFRVLSRLLGIENNIAISSTRAIFHTHAEQLMHGQEPEIFNQAIMEFGALCCIPKKPLCQECVVQDSCYAFEYEKQADLPLNVKKLKIRDRNFNYVVFITPIGLLLRERIAGDIWQGLHDFFNIEVDHLMTEDEVVTNLFTNKSNEVTVSSVSRDYKHILTHQRIYARFFTIEINDLNFTKSLVNQYGLKFCSREDLGKLPKPILINKFLVDEKIYIT